MRRAFAAVIATILVSTGLLLQVAAQVATSITFNYANVKYPGAPLTQVNGINNNNVVVGGYFDSSDFEHGFVYRNGKFTVVDFPGATNTEALGINDQGDIVGMYQVTGALNFHGFLRHQGVFTSIDDPKASFATLAFGINNSGVIVGSYDNAHGFVYENDEYTTLDAPQQQGETTDTQLNGISNPGWIAGQVFTGGIWRGFWVIGSDLDFLERMGNGDSQVTGINGHGDIVGCHDAQAGFVSFEVERHEGSESSETFPVQYPLASCPSAINYARVIVGNYFTVKRPYGYLAVPALTLNVTGPENHASVSNPVHLAATAFGDNPIAQIQVWVNWKEVWHVKGNALNASVSLPVGANERLAVQVVDAQRATTKVVETISVH